MIDLHLHTNASDGLCSPENLVHRAAAAGISALSVTDHDTMAGVAAARSAARALDLAFVPGIEITAVEAGRDVHVLGYFLDEDAAPLRHLLAAQRQHRVERAREIAARLDRAGAPIDVDALLGAAAARGGTVARPQVAAALVSAAHAASIADAFDRFLDEGCVAYVPHAGASAAEVVRTIVMCGGVASLAHPGETRRDDLLPSLVEAGLGALEAVHSAHDEATRARYLELAAAYGLGVSGGSDYHGEGRRRSEFLGRVGLGRVQFAAFCARAQRAAAYAGWAGEAV
jgi:predicted metal-dependent phosphoesterase TrpH